MKLHLLLATSLMATTVMASGTTYLIAVSQIGHVNDNGAPGDYEFRDRHGNVECVSDRGCVGVNGIFEVKVPDKNKKLDLELFPLREEYSISIMCKNKHDDLTDCRVTGDSERDGQTHVDATLHYDSSTKAGCTIVGDGIGTEEIEIEAFCK